MTSDKETFRRVLNVKSVMVGGAAESTYTKERSMDLVLQEEARVCPRSHSGGGALGARDWIWRNEPLSIRMAVRGSRPFQRGSRMRLDVECPFLRVEVFLYGLRSVSCLNANLSTFFNPSWIVRQTILSMTMGKY